MQLKIFKYEGLIIANIAILGTPVMMLIRKAVGRKL